MTEGQDPRAAGVARAAARPTGAAAAVDLAELLEHATFAVAGVDSEGIIRSMSGGIADISGIAPTAYLGRHWSAGIHPADTGTVRAATDGLAAASDGTRRTISCRFADSEDEWVPVEVEVTRRIDSPPGLYIVSFRALSDPDEHADRMEAFLRSVVDVPVDALTIIDEDGRIVWASPSTLSMWALNSAEAEGLAAGAMAHPDDLEAVESARVRVCAGEGPLSVEARMATPDGTWNWTRVRLTDLRDLQGVRGLVAVMSDIEDEIEARRSADRLASVFDATDDMVVLTDPEGMVTYANHAARGFLGNGLDELVDRPDLGAVVEGMRAALEADGPHRWIGEATLTGASGEARPVALEVLEHLLPSGERAFFSATARDISERIELHRELERQATHDPLTGLPNRMMLFERIRSASAAVGSEPGHRMGLLFIDLDHFKVINDSLGHAVGDKLLGAIARRVRTVVRPGDLVGRFGGDEFVVLCDEVESIDAATAVAGRVESTLEAPFRVDGHDIHVGVSIGIAFADEVADAEAILRDADTAMYRAKSGGRGRWAVFDDDLRRSAVERQEIEAALRKARYGDSLELHYQPIIDCSTMEVRGLEALLRWDRDGVLVKPASFMNVAEETGLIISIGRWVIQQACVDLARFQQLAGWSDLGVSVNVSAPQILRPEFIPTVESALAESGVGPGTVSIEITETAVVDDEIAAAAVLEELRALGVMVAIDDFGTGFSSLTYLHTLPVDVVKLDRSFIQGAGTDLQKRAIVEAVVNLTSVLGIAAVAEGVESREELAMLRRLGCGYAQGNLVSSAVPPEGMIDFLAHWSPAQDGSTR